MTAHSFFDSKNKEKIEFLPHEKNERFSVASLILLAVTFLLLISSIILSVFCIYKVKKVQEEVDYLRWDIDQLKSGLLNSNLLNDIRRFENEEIYSDDAEDTETRRWVQNDDLDADYDLNYEDEQSFPNGLVDDYNDSSSDHEDIFGLIKAGNLTKVGLEKDRPKRDVEVSAVGSVPINVESYETAKRKNASAARRRFHKKKALRLNSNGTRVSSSDENRPSNSPIQVLHGLKHYSELQNENSVSTAAPVLSRRSRVYHAEEKPKVYGRVVRKPRLKANTQWESVEVDSTASEAAIVRDEHPEHRRRNRHRQRNNMETFDERPRRMRLMPAIQFSGDTSKYIVGQHTNYNGNGHLRHQNPTYVDWIANDWSKTLNTDQYFHMDDGNLKIKETGLYFVYSQIFYLDEHDTNGYRVYKNKEVILQCTTMTHSVERVVKGNTCYTAGLEMLNEGDILSVQDLGTGRYSIFEPGKSFFGAIKMADVKAK